MGFVSIENTDGNARIIIVSDQGRRIWRMYVTSTDQATGPWYYFIEPVPGSSERGERVRVQKGLRHEEVLLRGERQEKWVVIHAAFAYFQTRLIDNTRRRRCMTK